MPTKPTTEDLLQERYKVIALYPDCPYKEGAILDGPRMKTLGPIYDKYPHIFRKLHWWEEREESDLPEYVKDESNNHYYKIEYSFASHTPSDVKTWNEFEPQFWNTLHNLEPATAEDYNNYIKNK